MIPDSMGRGSTRAAHFGVASVEKVLVMSTIIGMICFSTTMLGKFWDHSDLLQQALNSERIDESTSTNSLQNSRNQAGSNAKLASKQPSMVYWQLGVALLATATFLTAMVLTKERRRKKLIAPTPIDEVSKIQKMLEPKLAPGDVFSKRQLTMAILLNQLGEHAFSEMKIGHLVSSKVTTVLPSTSLVEIQAMFLKQHFRHLFVCDEEGCLHGIIRARDLQRATTGTARVVMSTDITTASPDQPVSPTITLMMDKRISCLPVVDGERLLGIVTTTDLLIALQCTLQILQTMTCTRTGNPASI